MATDDDLLRCLNDEYFSSKIYDQLINLLRTQLANDLAPFLDLIYAHSFFPTILKPTRITDHTATLIDNIFVNSKFS